VFQSWEEAADIDVTALGLCPKADMASPHKPAAVLPTNQGAGGSHQVLLCLSDNISPYKHQLC